MNRYGGALKTGLALAITFALGVGYEPVSYAQNAAVALPGREAPRVTQSVDTKSPATLANTRSPLAKPGKQLGVADSTSAMGHMQLVLKRSDERSAALAAFSTAQQDPHSPYFHQWLSADQYGQRFGVTDQDIGAVTAWLKSSGFKVNVVYPNRMQIDFSGTVAQVNTAFRTQQMKYVVGSATHIANSTDISVPAALASVVAGVAGLSDLHPKAMHTAIKHADKLSHTASKQSALSPYAVSAKAAGAKSVGAKTASAKTTGPQPQSITTTDGTRFLVPYDLRTVYNTKPLYDQGINGAGVTIAVVEDSNMVPSDWYDFVQSFHTGGGSFQQINPGAPGGVDTNCLNPAAPTADNEDGETTLDAEWATAMAPGANIVVATCDDTTTSNFFGGVYVAASNLINSDQPPDIISASYGYGEDAVDAGSISALHNMWQQAAAEGISVFVSTGDSGANPDYNGIQLIVDPSSANALATSPFVTAVGGTDLADTLDATTSTYFSDTPNFQYGTALSYVPEIPWNSSCGNSVAATAYGFDNAFDFCNAYLTQAGGPRAFFEYYLGFVQTPNPNVFSAEGASGGYSTVESRPSWQSSVNGTFAGSMRAIPDVALYGGSFTPQVVVFCTAAAPCRSGDFPNGVAGTAGTSLSTPMFAGLQALIDQAAKGKQGVSAPILYALAAQEYGDGTSSSAPASLAACSSDNGAQGTSACVFHNITRGGISTNCLTGVGNCTGGISAAGLTSLTDDGSSFAEYAASPGWNIATGLGSVNANNLVGAWLGYLANPGGPVVPSSSRTSAH